MPENRAVDVPKEGPAHTHAAPLSNAVLALPCPLEALTSKKPEASTLPDPVCFPQRHSEGLAVIPSHTGGCFPTIFDLC